MASATGVVGQDPEQPGPQRPAGVVGRRHLDGGQKGGLDQILRVAGLGTEVEGELEQVLSGPVEDLAERRGIAPAMEALEELLGG